MKKKTLLTAVILTGLMLINSAFSQDTEARIKFGAFASVNVNVHSSDFRSLPGIPSCCPHYTSGSGAGFSGGLAFEYLFWDFLGVELRPGWQTLGGVIATNEETYLNFQGSAVKGTFEHSIDASIGGPSAELLLDFRPAESFSLMAGINFIFISDKTYVHKEEITKPDYGTFMDTGTRTRNVYDGDIPDAASMSAGLTFGLRYEFPLNAGNTLRIAPEIFYTAGLTDMIQDSTWKISSFRFGLSVSWHPPESAEKKESETEKPYKEEEERPFN